jgi:lipid-A-disaccharide synthase-like uncharacterized protein
MITYKGKANHLSGVSGQCVFSRRYLHAVLAQETAVDSAMERLIVLHCYQVELCG